MALLTVWMVACFWFFASQLQYHFFYQEQNQLFLIDGEYMLSYLGKPAWLAMLLGDALTQMYYYLYAGPAILTLVLAVLGDVVCRSLTHILRGRMSAKTASWPAFAIALIVMTIEAWLSLNEGYRLSSIIALAGGVTLWWLTDLLLTRFGTFWLRIVMAIVVGWLAYWLFGYGMLAFILLEMLNVFANAKTITAKTWQTGLLPVAALVPLLLFVIPFAPRCYNIDIDTALTYPGMWKSTSWKGAKLLERILAYDNDYYFGKYDKVVERYERETADGTQEMTDEMSFFYCLSLEQQGVLAARLPEMKHPVLGTFITIDDKTPMLTIKMINELYWLLGDMTYTERAALLANTFSPNGRNVRMVKRLAEANLVSGDTAAAMKYLRLLQKTLLYSGWARDHTPATMSAEVKGEIERKHKFVNTQSTIRLGDDCYVILTELLDSNPDNTVALDYLFCSDMLSHQKDVFVRDYEKYGEHCLRPVFREIYQSAKAE